MKIFTKTATILAMMCLIAGFFTQIHACDRSDVTLDSVAYGRDFVTIYATLCIGGGKEGASTGAAADTREIAFAFYSQNSGLQILTFTPDSIVGDTTGTAQGGINVGPVASAPFFSQATIGYFDPSGGTLSYMCVSSTALCGRKHTQCTQFSFTTNLLPDSMRVFGVEGSGNPAAGCMPNPDMAIDFTSLPVIWGHFEAESSGDGNRLSWSTLTQSNNDHFEVQRSAEGNQFYTLTELAGAGNSNANLRYDYFDQRPLVGSNFYRIRQVDLDGNFSYSKVVTVNYAPTSDLQYLTVAPNPSNGMVQVQYISAKNAPLKMKIFDIRGKQYFERKYQVQAGTNLLRLDMQAFPGGIYFLRISEGGSWIDHKIVLL